MISRGTTSATRIYLNGQGATSRKLEPERFRRTTEGGGPRQPTFDEEVVRALSINEASHVYHMPRHFLRDKRPGFVAYLTARGLPASNPPAESPTMRFSKWPKERMWNTNAHVEYECPCGIRMPM